MRVILFGATGMVGQGVLRECLLDPGVERVLAVGRSRNGGVDAKLRELVHRDFLDFGPIERELTGYDACFWCLGISSAGMNESDYRRVTQDYALAAAKLLVRVNPGMTFVFVSGMGTDSTEKGRSMWGRVKGATENAIARLPFKATYMFRPGFIRAMHGIRSRTRSYRLMYAVLSPFVPLLMALFPKATTTTERLGRAMLRVVRDGGPSRVLESAEIDALGR